MCVKSIHLSLQLGLQPNVLLSAEIATQRFPSFIISLAMPLEWEGHYYLRERNVLPLPAPAKMAAFVPATHLSSTLFLAPPLSLSRRPPPSTLAKPSPSRFLLFPLTSTTTVSASASASPPGPIDRSRGLDADSRNVLYGSSLRRASGCDRAAETCVLVGVDVTTRANARNRLFGIDDSIAELSRLAETAGMDVVGVVTQQLSQPFNGTYVGTGKVGEIRAEMEAVGCKTCVFDDELSPAQQRTLEKAFGGEAKGIKVLDRTALILDIFGQHAASREGQLQVELAMYQYRLPRLTRMWTHLERQSGGGSGGAGLRGPGETQLESDRRMINTRIVKLKKDIDGVRLHRGRQRSARRSNVGLPVVALVGYTNSGKSTVLNSLTGADVLEADALFATLDPTTRRAKLEGLKLSPEILLTDTVGFVQNLPTQLVAAFRATLEEVTEADVLVHVVDSSLPWELLSSQITAVDNVLGKIGGQDKPTIIALNKIDLFEANLANKALESTEDGEQVEDEDVTHRIRSDSVISATEKVAEMSLSDLILRVSEFTGYECVAISAKSGVGCDEVGALLEETLQDVLLPVEAVVPYHRGELVAALHEQGSCEFEDFTEKGTHIIGRAPHGLASRLREFVISGNSDDGVDRLSSEEDESEEIDWTALARGRH